MPPLETHFEVAILCMDEKTADDVASVVSNIGYSGAVEIREVAE